MMHYISTRGKTEPRTFQETVITGLAPDGGLLIPESIPDFSRRLYELGKMSYTDLAATIIQPFVDIPQADLQHLIKASYSQFRGEIAPIIRAGPVHILELFHGPTLAFKDFALQWLGNLFEYILARTNKELNILAATSGDTGSAAIYGVRGRRNIRIFVLYPHGRISPVQEKQMTSVGDNNVFPLAVEGTFDDCQNIMKAIFCDAEFKNKYSLGAVNSVNWARILAQIVYYFYAGLQVLQSTKRYKIQFAVPTGNFGNILAGYYAWRMGLPIARLILATNENDILSRFFQTGIYSRSKVLPTLSPSMDIQVASNFERYLYYRLKEIRHTDPSKELVQLLQEFEKTGSVNMKLPLDQLFVAGATGTAETVDTIRKYYLDYTYLLDPHTAAGINVAEQHLFNEWPTICLATAHPAKFEDAIRQATGKDLATHEKLAAIAIQPTRRTVLPAKEQVIKDFIRQHAG